jgi:hypothetical protein
MVIETSLMTGKDLTFAVIHVISYPIIKTIYSDTVLNQMTNFRIVQYEYLMLSDQ